MAQRSSETLHRFRSFLMHRWICITWLIILDEHESPSRSPLMNSNAEVQLRSHITRSCQSLRDSPVKKHREKNLPSESFAKSTYSENEDDWQYCWLFRSLFRQLAPPFIRTRITSYLNSATEHHSTFSENTTITVLFIRIEYWPADTASLDIYRYVMDLRRHILTVAHLTEYHTE